MTKKLAINNPPRNIDVDEHQFLPLGVDGRIGQPGIGTQRRSRIKVVLDVNIGRGFKLSVGQQTIHRQAPGKQLAWFEFSKDHDGRIR